MIPLPSLTDSAAALGLTVLGIALVVLGRWTAPEANPVTETDTVRVEAPLTPSEIMDATTPTQVTEYDTSETRTQCIEVPTWIGRLRTGRDTNSVSGRRTSPMTSGMRSLTESDSLTSLNTTLRGPAFATIPMLGGGSPSLSLGTEQVTLSGYLPDGRGRQWTYDLPQDEWGVGLESSFTFARWVQGTLTADVSRHAEWGPLDVRTRFGLGYGALVTDGAARVSPVARAGFRIGYDW